MGFFHDIHRGETKLDFPKQWRIAITVSIVLSVIGIGSLVLRGLDRSIEFEGGTQWEVKAPGVSVSDARDFLRPLGEAQAKIQVVDGTTLRIQSELKDPAKAGQIKEELTKLGEVESIQSVGPTWGKQIRNKSIQALVVFFVLLALYIWWRLEWQMAIGAMVAVFHDVIITVGIYSVFHLLVSPATVVAFLTILGYSLYDTVVVYDKVHELSARPAVNNRYTYTDMMNLALNQVLTRSIATTLAAVIPLASLLIYGSIALGASTLQEFAIALLFGLLSGAYSSLYVASPIVAFLKEREPRHREVRERLRARGALGDGTTLLDAREVAGVTGSATPARPAAGGARPAPGGVRPAGAAAGGGTARPVAGGGAIPPRPRKKKRR